MKNKNLSFLNTIKNRFSDYIGEVVYGGLDGIITTFAVVAGFVGAGASATLGDIGPLAVVLFGLANLFGDGVSMGLGKYLSTKSEQDMYLHDWNNTQNFIQKNNNIAISNTLTSLLEQGLEKEQANTIVEIMRKYPNIWIKRKLDNELVIPDVRDQNAYIEGLSTLLSFIVFGSIPLIPYIFLENESNFWIISIIMTGISLALLGVVRWYITKMNFFQTVSQMIILGTTAAGVAYGVGYLVMQYGG